MSKFNISSLLICITLFTGCVATREVDVTDVSRSAHAAAISARSQTIKDQAIAIHKESGRAIHEFKNEINSGEVDSSYAVPKQSRWERVGAAAVQIEQLAIANEKSGDRIVKISMGTWHTTWWFRSIIGLVIFGVIVIALLLITHVARQWGFISYVRNMNESIADGMADMLDADERINNNDLNEEMCARIRKRKGRKNKALQKSCTTL